MTRVRSALATILYIVIGVPILLGAFGAAYAFFMWMLAFGPAELWVAVTTVIRVGFHHEWKFAEVILVLLAAFLIVRKR